MASPYAHSHLSDQTLLRDLAASFSRERTNTAVLLSQLAEVDARRLYLPAGYPSLHAYCVHHWRLTEQAAFKRIRAARTASQFPAIFEAVAAGRLNLSGVVLLAPHLTAESAAELLAAAAEKSNPEIEQLLAERFPRPDVPARVVPLAPPPDPMPPGQLSARTVGDPTEFPAGRTDGESIPTAVQLSARTVAPLAPPPKVKPLAPERFLVQFTFGKEANDKLSHAQALLSHRVPRGDVAQVFERALDALIRDLEKAKFAATDKPRPSRSRPAPGSRHIPADVKRAVWERDGGRCTFVSDSGRRCPARRLLEFDHIQEFARGGHATVEGMRLRCRAHNQYGAECTFGVGFMANKRQQARHAAARELNAQSEQCV